MSAKLSAVERSAIMQEQFNEIFGHWMTIAD